MKESWIGIKDFDSYYQVSNLGRVKRLPRLSKNSRNDSYKPYGEKILSLKSNNPRKYITVGLTVDSVSTSRQLHRLVLCNFKPCKNMDKLEVNHKNGDKHDCRLLNLEWNTRQQNVDHAIENKFRVTIYGEDTNSNKITKQ